jgi:hypothetical protein
MSQNVTVSYFSHSLFQHFPPNKIRRKIGPTLMSNFACFKKVGLIYSRVVAGAGAVRAWAASKFFTQSRSLIKNDAALQICLVVWVPYLRIFNRFINRTCQLYKSLYLHICFLCTSRSYCISQPVNVRILVETYIGSVPKITAIEISGRFGRNDIVNSNENS